MSFADSRFLLALAVDDAHSVKAERWVEHHPESLVATDLVLFETFNLKTAIGGIISAQVVG